MSNFLKTTLAASTLALAVSATATQAETVDLVIYYTPDAESKTADIDTRIQYYLDHANEAYTTSGVDLKLKMVDKVKTRGNYDALDVDYLKDNYLTYLQNYRDSKNADLVVFIGTTAPWPGGGTVCGQASDIPSSASSLRQDGFFNVTGVECDHITFTHELGHNMGLNHSPRQASGGGFYSYGKGFGVDGEFVTIMAYPSAYGWASRELNRFSSPTANDSITGFSLGDATEANAVKALNNAKAIIAGVN